MLVLAAGGAAAAYLLTEDDSDAGRIVEAPAPQVVIPETPEPEQPTDLGFPTFATKNTTRVAGADPTADAAAIALAVYPSTGRRPRAGRGDARRPRRLAGRGRGCVAASPTRSARRSCSPTASELPDLTAEAIRSLAPAGHPGHRRPPDVRGRRRRGGEAGGVRRRRGGRLEPGRGRGGDRRACGRSSPASPSTSSSRPTRSPRSRCRRPAGRRGRATRSSTSGPTPSPRRRRRRSRRTTTCRSTSSAPRRRSPTRSIKELERTASSVERIGADDPVENAIEFARFVERQLRLEHQRPRPRLRDRQRLAAARRRRRRAAVGERHLGPAAAHR